MGVSTYTTRSDRSVDRATRRAAVGRFRADEWSLEELVNAASQGDERCWVELVERYEALVWKSVNMVVSDSTLREEAASATWLKAARSLRSLREPAAFPGWLRTTAMNEAYSLVRVSLRVRLDPLRDDVGSAVDPHHDENAGDLLDDERQLVRGAFERLSPKCRRVLAALVLDENFASYAEAASQLGLPVGALGPTRRRCLDQMRESPEIHRLTHMWR